MAGWMHCNENSGQHETTTGVTILSEDLLLTRGLSIKRKQSLVVLVIPPALYVMF